MFDTSLLLVDPNPTHREDTASVLESAFPGGTVSTADSYESAVQILSADIDAVVTRYHIGESTGVELVAYVRENWPETDCFLYAETTDIETESFEEIVVEFVPKDTMNAPETLIALIKQADVASGQREYPIPDCDKERVAHTRAHADDIETVVEPLERLVALAVTYFDRQTAAVSVIDDQTQRVLAQEGPHSLPERRAESVNTHTLAHDEATMAVPDLREDPRFEDTERGTDGPVSYLGAQIPTDDGYVLGVLSLHGDSPETFSEADRDYLQTLAHLASDILRLNRQHLGTEVGGHLDNTEDQDE